MSVYFRDSSLAVSTRILLEPGTPYTFGIHAGCAGRWTPRCGLRCSDTDSRSSPIFRYRYGEYNGTVPCGAGKGKGKCSQSEAEAWEGYCESDDKRPFVNRIAREDDPMLSPNSLSRKSVLISRI